MSLIRLVPAGLEKYSSGFGLTNRVESSDDLLGQYLMFLEIVVQLLFGCVSKEIELREVEQVEAWAGKA